MFTVMTLYQTLADIHRPNYNHSTMLLFVQRRAAKTAAETETMWEKLLCIFSDVPSLWLMPDSMLIAKHHALREWSDEKTVSKILPDSDHLRPSSTNTTLKLSQNWTQWVHDHAILCRNYLIAKCRQETSISKKTTEPVRTSERW